MSPTHRIAGSEAFAPRPLVQIRELPRRRPRLSLVARWHLAALAAGGALSLIDALIGAPVCLTIAVIVFLGLWLRG